jgi:hypothetical protein
LIDRAEIVEEPRRRGDIGALAIGLRACLPPAIERVEPALKLRFRLEASRERVAPRAQREAPIGDRACRISRQRLVERRDRT